MKHAQPGGLHATAALAATALAIFLLLGAAPVARSTESTAAPGKAGPAGAVIRTAPMKAGGSGVVVQYQLDDAPAGGATVPVVLVFGNISDPDGATVRLSVDGGLSLAPGGETVRRLPAGQAVSWTVELKAPAAGTGYLNVFTTQFGATSATSIPVQVGKAPAAMPASGSLKQGRDGEKILPMKVK
ncbi:hypothetical protein QTH87_00020 [Variovorax sp. J22P168]|uniref:hypothetical protein n=1 Tax=Variovorax jilinensis TaxID=3053513 RepID=UPI002578DC65|nr:hypothetical protein [Variovorax sp. J22P168]MDM0010809.1 hypothetical protein [Variovorax sp. J22P168]